MTAPHSASSWRSSDGSDPVSVYARDVVEGRLPAGQWHRAACARHLRDLETAEAQGLVWKPWLGWKVVLFARLCRHFKGRQWAGRPVELEPWEVFIVGSLFGWTRAQNGFRRFVDAFVELPRGQGKALAVDTPVPTPTGWKAHGDLRPGDDVLSPDGRAVPVRAVTAHHMGPCYAVATSDGAEIVAHAKHEWRTFRTWYTGRPKGSRRPLPLVTTETIARTLRCEARRPDFVHRLAVTRPVDLPAADLPVHPYVLGAWLGDGHSAAGRITTADPEVLDGLRSAGEAVRLVTGTGTGRAATYAVTKGRAQRDRDTSLQARLRGLGVLGRKHIPRAYLRASRTQRQALLRGLMDTDGHITAEGQCEIVTIQPQLAEDITELVRTLGHKPSCITDAARLRGRVIGDRYRVQFYPLTDDPVATVARKVARQRLAKAYGRRRTITEARPVGERVVNCIEVEGGDYLVGRHFVPTHNSTLAAILVLYMTFFDGEPGADGYCYATKKDQARIVFRTARRFVTSSPLLKTLVTPYRSTLFNEETESKIEILGSDSDNQDGLRPHVAVADEIHRQKTPDMMEVVESGMGTLDQPLHFKITTAGEIGESVYDQQVRISTQVLDGTVDIPEWFAFIACADPEDDPEDDATWRKANPNYGISVNPDFLRKEAKKARANPYEWVKFRRLYLGQKVGAADGYLPLTEWDACMDQARVPDDVLRAVPCWLGLDLSSRVDLTAGVLVWLLPDGRCVWRPKFWVPKADLEERRRRDRVPFPAWVAQGDVEGTEGNVVHLGVVREWIVEQKATWPLLQEVCYDPWGAGELVQTLKDDHGVRVVEVRQGPKTLSEPMKRTQALVLEHDLDPSDNPVLRWNAGNMKARRDANENVAPCKRTSRGRIDGMTAGITAMSRALLQPVKKKSRYSDPAARVEAVRLG